MKKVDEKIEALQKELDELKKERAKELESKKEINSYKDALSTFIGGMLYFIGGDAEINKQELNQKFSEVWYDSHTSRASAEETLNYIKAKLIADVLNDGEDVRFNERKYRVSALFNPVLCIDADPLTFTIYLKDKSTCEKFIKICRKENLF